MRVEEELEPLLPQVRPAEAQDVRAVDRRVAQLEDRLAVPPRCEYSLEIRHHQEALGHVVRPVGEGVERGPVLGRIHIARVAGVLDPLAREELLLVEILLTAK